MCIHPSLLFLGESTAQRGFLAGHDVCNRVTQARGESSAFALVGSMSAPIRPPRTETMRFHRWQFFAERVGWCLMFLMLVFALIGGFGRGWISRAAASSEDDTLQIQYERFGRLNADCELRVVAKATDDTVRLRFDRAFIESVRLEAFTPQFESSVLERDGVTFDFKSADDAGDRTIVMRYQPQTVGSLVCRLQLDDRQTIEFSQFIYP